VHGVELHQQGMDAELLHPRRRAFDAIGIPVPERGAEVGVRRLLGPGDGIKQVAGQVGGAVLPQTGSQPCIARTSATTTERISGPSSLKSVPLGSSSRKQLMSRGRSGVSVGCSVCRNAWARAGERKRGSAPISRAHWQTLAPQMPTWSAIDSDCSRASSTATALAQWPLQLVKPAGER
jgi:hypothetical protein